MAITQDSVPELLSDGSCMEGSGWRDGRERGREGRGREERGRQGHTFENYTRQKSLPSFPDPPLPSGVSSVLESPPEAKNSLA